MDRFNVNQSLSTNWDHLEENHVGTGNPNTIDKQTFGKNIIRDTLASHLGRNDQMSMFSTIENESVEQVRINMLNKILDPINSSKTSNRNQQDVNLNIDKIKNSSKNA